MGAQSSRPSSERGSRRWSQRLSLSRRSKASSAPKRPAVLERGLSDKTDTSWMRRQPVGFAMHDDDEDETTGPAVRGGGSSTKPPMERVRSEIVRPTLRGSTRSLVGLGPEPPRKSLFDRPSRQEDPAEAPHIGSRRVLVKITPPDQQYVDFTVVPLLLRSGLTYQQATDFGAHLMESESQETILTIMESAGSLVDELTKAGVSLTERVQLKLETDRLWTTKRKSVSAQDARKSFVYYRSDERTQSLRAEVRARKSLADQAPPTSLRAAHRTRPRSQFNGGRTEIRPGEDADLSPEQLERLATIISMSKRSA